ncbi:MAG: DNA replication/repair protein RecF [Bacteroidetes bacterium]|nr:DNA replication/repair protein RecF [Bacteroidota bacterium]
MHFDSIHLINYKCYIDARVDLHPMLNCIVGQNGAGKTNLMDALYYTCFAKSYFTHKDQFVLRKGADFIRLEANLQIDNADMKIAVKVPSSGKKEIIVNGQPVERLSEHAGKFPAVMIAPDDNQIILGGSELRRKFMDGCISQYSNGYLIALLKYHKLLKQRNAALKHFRRTGRTDEVLLDSLDLQMLPLAILLHEERKDFMKAFVPYFTARYADIAGKEELTTIDYRSELTSVNVKDLMEASRREDLAAGRTLIGPHRDDLVFRISGSPVKSVGSQGQQKSFLVALKMAQYALIEKKRGFKPFLFLDDLFDKFDAHRVEHLMRMVSEGYFGQVFITDTHEERVSGIVKKYNLEHRIIKIESATISNG